MSETNNPLKTMEEYVQELERQNRIMREALIKFANEDNWEWRETRTMHGTYYPKYIWWDINYEPFFIAQDALNACKKLSQRIDGGE